MRAFHGTSKTNFKPGSSLRPRKGGVHSDNPLTMATESVLEHVRLAHYPQCLSRLKCVFASEYGDPINLCAVGANLGRVLECEVSLSLPERSNVGYYSAIRRAISAGVENDQQIENSLNHWAEEYWQGSPFDRNSVTADMVSSHIDPVIVGFLPDAWELRCQSLQVLQVHNTFHGVVNGFTLNAWGQNGNMLTISAADTPQVRSVLANGFNLTIAGGVASACFRNDQYASARLIAAISEVDHGETGLQITPTF